MSLDKSIEYGKEHRKPYHGAKAVDSTCRNNGGCPWCEENRLYKYRCKELAVKQQMDEFYRNCRDERRD